MRLQRVHTYNLAKVIASGVRRYNDVSLSPRRIMARPHFAIRVRGQLAGWIGYEVRRAGVYEIAHLSVLPRFRRRGLAERATAQMLGRMRRAGGRVVYARTKRSNYAAQSILRKFAFKRVGRGRVYKYVRPL